MNLSFMNFSIEYQLNTVRSEPKEQPYKVREETPEKRNNR